MSTKLTKRERRRLTYDPIFDGPLNAGDLRRDDNGDLLFNLKKAVAPPLDGQLITIDEACEYLDVPKADLRRAINRGDVREVEPGLVRARDIRAYLPGVAVCSTAEVMALLDRSRSWIMKTGRRYGLVDDAVGNSSRFTKKSVNIAAGRLRRGELDRRRHRVCVINSLWAG